MGLSSMSSSSYAVGLQCLRILYNPSRFEYNFFCFIAQQMRRQKQLILWRFHFKNRVHFIRAGLNPVGYDYITEITYSVTSESAIFPPCT